MFLKDLLLKIHEIGLLYLKFIYYLNRLSIYYLTLSSFRLARESRFHEFSVVDILKNIAPSFFIRRSQSVARLLSSQTNAR